MQPDVSIVIACYNAAEFLSAAVASALAQDGVSVEVLIVDDHSTDQSLDLARQLEADDARIRVFQTPENSGPGGARNVGIQNMQGRWYAVLDSDDLIAPDRSKRMILHAEQHGFDMVADDLLIFGDNIESRRYLDGFLSGDGEIISPDDYFAGTRMFSAEPNLGFLKPMIKSEFLKRSGIRYREDLRIGEDDELIVRLLLGGAVHGYLDEAMYQYRKHESSISHRLSAENAKRMLASENQIAEAVKSNRRNSPAYRARHRSIRNAADFAKSVEALKSKDILAAVAPLFTNPAAALHYWMPIKARWARWGKRQRS